MKKLNKLTILIPCRNEEKGIGRVIDDIPRRILKKLGYKVEIIVINNNSTDKTAHVALKRKAIVITETKKGKGNATKAGFRALNPDTVFVVMIDGDNTYKSKEIPRLVELLASDFCDAVIGSRLGGKIKRNSLKFQNRVANWTYTFLVRQIYRANVTDVLSGYFAWKKEVIDKLYPHLRSEGFEIEMEMITKMKKLGFDVYSVPITYDPREGESKLNKFRDGALILYTLFKNLLWNPNRNLKKVSWEGIKGYEYN
ncbi:MAG: glycosyltransferase family 2 protein [Patescibacteria group bacterium]|nr:glycosyltransferase family 2 protein [Patescibacteria group bacterium]